MLEHKNEYSSNGSYEPSPLPQKVRIKEKKKEEKGFGNYDIALRDKQHVPFIDELDPADDPILKRGNFIVNEKALDDWTSQLYGYKYWTCPKAKPVHMSQLPHPQYEKIRKHKPLINNPYKGYFHLDKNKKTENSSMTSSQELIHFE